MNRANNSRVALLGDINIDVFLNIPAYPPNGGDALVYDMVMGTGGSVANTAVVLARLGVPTDLISRTGEDLWASTARKTFEAEGVGLRYVPSDPKIGTGLIFISVTPDGERTMFSFRGANVNLSTADLPSDALDDTALLHLSGYSFLRPPQSEAAWWAVEKARARGMRITLDLGVEPAIALGEDLGRLLGLLDLLVLGDQEAIKVAGCSDLDCAIDWLLARGVREIGLKLGKEGCLIITPERRVRLTGFPVDAIDTTGAGDAFSAGVIFGILNNLSLEATGLLANALGALATTQWGGGASMPALDEVRAFLQQHGAAWQPFVDEVLNRI